MSMRSTLDKTALRKALKRLDHARVQRLLEPLGWREEDVDEVLRQLIHTGCLIQPYTPNLQSASRSKLIRLISEHSTVGQLERLLKHLLQAVLLQLAFKELRSTISKTAVAQLQPSDQVWAVVDRAIRELTEVFHTVQKTVEPSTDDEPHFLTHVGIYVEHLSAEPVDADAVVNGLQSFLYLTLKMLAYENKWWSTEGVLVLPSRRFPPSDHLFKAGIHMPLATAWDTLHSVSESLRFFGGDAVVTQESDPEGGNALRRVIEIKKFDSPPPVSHS